MFSNNQRCPHEFSQKTDSHDLSTSSSARQKSTAWSRAALTSLAVAVTFLFGAPLAHAQGSNPITIENAKTGNPSTQWDIVGSGDPSIQGFATDISVNKGGTVRFKIDTDATAYRLDIYRLGYYNGMGARFITSVLPSATLPQLQNDPITDAATGLIDCGNWTESASWVVPADSTSGVYLAKLVRTDVHSGSGTSHIAFIVRDDASTSDILFQTSDTTWQAYNTYGGNSLYVGNPAGRAYKVSYNRPFVTRDGETSRDWLFNAEYPMIRWLESNGYNVSYTTGIDSDRRGNLLLQHKAFLSVGHDEYWSAAQRTNVEAARGSGMHMAFFSGNEVFWKVRWENSIDGSGTPYRTMVCYKETHAGAKIDPTSTWTGTWRDPRFSPPSDGGKPENSLTGTLFTVNGTRTDSIVVPAAYGAHRFWRNTSAATLPTDGSVIFPAGTLGYEWDEVPENGSRPTGIMYLSQTTVSGVNLLQDYGSTYEDGTATHKLALYRHSSGALVFGTGTVQWSWGLDSQHDNGDLPANLVMRQATVNLFADMGLQPGTLQAGLTAAVKSTDTVAPVVVIQSPVAGASLANGTPVAVTGTASDASGKVWNVEFSTDGGTNWSNASGLLNWSFSWTPSQSGAASIRVRAVDDSGNLSTATVRNVTVTGNAPTTVSLWPATTVPGTIDGGPDGAVELGVKFRSDVAGTITGIRFYKAATNTGVHTGSLWSSTGTQLATATFNSETASGWQQVNFSTPVAITANTVYVASYHANSGHYSADTNYFLTAGRDNAPLHALANSVSVNGVYAYGAGSTFPNETWNAANYWVDVMFRAAAAPTLTSIAVSPTSSTVAVGATRQYTATGTYTDGSTQNLTSQVTWTSSTPARATIDSTGLVSGVSVGTTNISATLGSLSNSTALTVQAAPLAITTAGLVNGTVGTAYSATLTASGGTTPYTWSRTAGTLPNGLSLSTSGVLSGTPTLKGTFNFTVQARDTGSPVQTVTKALSIVITTTLNSIAVTPANPSITAGATQQFTATGTYSDGATQNITSQVTWASSNTARATISSSGLASALTPGTTSITATFGIRTGTTTLTVQPLPIAISTASLAGAIVGTPYSANLAATGGTVPYTWSVSSGSLPAGLTLNATSGVISGTPTTAASVTFTARVADAGNPVQAVTKSLTVLVTPAPITLWSNSEVPVSIDEGPDTPVELGVKFRSDMAGTITGIRFYKAAANTGVHIGNLWSSTGTLLASATFNSETASGWQQVNFSTPVAITANTVYVASYHVNGGHYSADTNYFLTAGRDNAPLHALASGVSGANGVYAYGANSVFPAESWKATNYWVDVVYQAPTLTSIAVSPTSSTVAVGATRQYTATGTYTDGSTQNLTSQVTWTSSTPARATIDSTGLVSGVSVGTTNISATLGSLSNSTALTVQAAPLAITTAGLVNGTVGTAYSATLTASGGTTPYTWSRTAGTLPNGLSLSTSGVLSGTPTLKGTFNFTVQARDTGSPVQTVTKALSIVITTTLNSIAVTPANPSITAGATQQFTATGTYSDGATQNITSQVTWASSNTARATISSSGLASALTPGTTSITATFGIRTGTTTLTVQPLPIAISTASLAGAIVGTPYSANLAATGGTVPYTWSVSSGSLPAGLTLNATSGVISGTPTTAASVTFTARVADAGNPVQAVTKSLSILVLAAPATIWPNSTVPVKVDDGPDSPVELGVKFRSDVAGTITGIRFYKAAANTGVHIGNLWSSTGTLLATATFDSETASGWQQVNFSTPVAITANTVYVASYHVNGGHYSADTNYFLTAGRDNAPLHALANGISGANGVFAYGSSSVFPNQPTSGNNYWVDVIFQAPTLTSLAIAPVSSTVFTGATKQYVATGTYTDGSTQDLSGQVTWASSVPSRATVASTGLVSGVSVGATTISASSGSLAASTTLTVQLAPLAITTSTMPTGMAGTAYSASLAASGGTTPYTWSRTAGTLPTGLTLNASTGTLTGTPTTKGTYNFTIQARDTSNPIQTVTKTLSIVITASLNSIAITPSAPTILAGATQQFTATGTYSDGNTQNLTSQVTWTSSAPAKATIATTGLATAVSAGTSTITATFGAVTRTITLTVQATPISLTTTSLPSGIVGTPYSTTLAASGGTTPYIWSLASGSLPAGLTLNPTTGTISGIPSSMAVTSGFTVQVTDVGSPAQTMAVPMGIVIIAPPATIWPNETIPQILDIGVDDPVELGVKFRSDVSGTITGIRFYKGNADTGAHIGNLWSSTGTLLASAIFTNESASGWQQVLFTTPVNITADTVYVASYHVNGGHYTADPGYFTSPSTNDGPIHALADGVSGPNGVYGYGASSVFPTVSWNATNYWVDVLFAASGTLSPQVNFVNPANDATAVPISSAITVVFNEPMNPSDINSSTITLKDSLNNTVPSAINYNSTTSTVSITPNIALNAASAYTITIKGNVGGITDMYGNFLPTSYVSTFSTMTYGAEAGGPGGPILVLTNADNPFSKYYAEILLANGLNSFAMADISTISASSLAPYDVVILGESVLSSAQVTTLTNWVNAGGNLIAMRPDKKLASLLGLISTTSSFAEGYLLVNTTSKPGTGIVGQTIQYHGTADLYTLAGATTVATLYSNVQTGTSNPAITLRNVGSNGGQAATFTFDLAKSIVYTRQGNPAWANQSRDGQPLIRSDDLFYGAASFDPQPDWVNLDKVAIPQADEQQYLLANLIISMNSDRKPLPRFWLFPHGHKAAVVMTGDDHGTTYGGYGGTRGRFDTYKAYSPASGSVKDWQTIRSTSYVFPGQAGALSDAEAAAYTAEGFEVSLHLYTYESNYTAQSLDALFTEQINQFKFQYPSLSSITTNRTHAIVWCGYTTMPEVGLLHGVRLDTNYYFWPAEWVQDRAGMFTGSGLPMRFASAQGNVIDVYQATTQMTDESGQSFPYTMDTLLDRALGQEGYYGAFVANMHTDLPNIPQSDAIILSAVSRGVPVISANQLLTWTDARNSSAIKSISKSGNILTFTVTAASGAHGLQTMVPLNTGQTVSSVQRNGVEIASELKLIKGIQYVVFPSASGIYQLILSP